MNREIKFRGKTNEMNSWWTYGNLVICDNGDYQIGNCPKYGDIYYRNEVIAATVGQYTGLHDKNGKEIYEGDIVTGTKYPFMDNEKQNYIGIVVFYEDVAQFGYEYKCVNKDKKGISNGINNKFEANENLICEDLEVMGNIYENKELLEA